MLLYPLKSGGIKTANVKNFYRRASPFREISKVKYWKTVQNGVESGLPGIARDGQCWVDSIIRRLPPKQATAFG